MGRRLLRGLFLSLLHHVPYRVWGSKEGLEAGKKLKSLQDYDSTAESSAYPGQVQYF